MSVEEIEALASVPVLDYGNPLFLFEPVCGRNNICICPSDRYRLLLLVELNVKEALFAFFFLSLRRLRWRAPELMDIDESLKLQRDYRA